MNFEEIKELIRNLESSRLKKLVYKKGDFELTLEKEDSGAPKVAHVEKSLEHKVEHPVSHHPVSHHKGAKKEEVAEGRYVTSPMVGTFYGSPGPGEPSFVKVGDRVTEQTVVCIIEAMKVMNEVKAGMSGVVAEVMADNGGPVEFGSRLLRIQ